MTVVHLVVGPEGHGVVRHAADVARACGHPVVRRATPDAVTAGDLAGAEVVHTAFTDRLFGASCEQSAVAFGRVAGLVTEAGATLSVTLHDLPMGTTARARRRRQAYAAVVASARGVVVSSRHELALAAELDDDAWSRRVIPLPVDPVGAPAPDDVAGDEVVVLGFVHPDRGHEHTIAESPPGGTVVALGAAAAGHDELPRELSAAARRAGRRWHLTGHVPEERLGPALRRAAVPVAPHRHVSASASIATWIAHGRRPLVPDTSYARELETQWPGTLRRYDPDTPGALRREIDAALADPAATVLDRATATGPTLATVAAAYRSHIAACAPPAARRIGRHHVVPGNRWDLLDGLAPGAAPEVSVVVPYYEAQEHLDLVLRALARQTHPAARLQVVVADDGSRHPPDLGAAGPLAATTVRQEDRGFRAAAARNLGAAAADGEVVAFLDGDTVPEAGYVAALARLPALAPDALVVGRRCHSDAAGLRAWLDGERAAPPSRPAPAWLDDGYAASRDLLDADERSYRFVISAVLAMHRDLLTELGGFDPTFTTYGGEDWELASRAWNAGALLAHVPDAVAWHVGPDWAGRAGDPAAKAAQKAAEDAALARVVPDPVARGRARSGWPYPRTVVLVPDRCPDLLAAARLAVRRGDLDAGVWVDGPPGAPPVDVLARARVVVRPTASGGVGELIAAESPRGSWTTSRGAAHHTRAAARARRWAARCGVDEGALAAWFSGHHDLP